VSCGRNRNPHCPVRKRKSLSAKERSTLQSARLQLSINEKEKNFMKKMLCKLIAICVLATPLAGAAQSTDSMKQDQPQQDQMKHDDIGQDQAKKDDMGKDEMKDKKGKRAKKDKMKKDDMKKDDNMKHDDTKNDSMKQN
jgi:pentapeptide MXKDX repeat protein